MTTFVARVRTSYADLEGLLLHCRGDGLASDGSLWRNDAPPARPISTGAHTGANNQPVLTDAHANWRDDILVGRTVYNMTDGSQGTVTGNTSNQVSATLAGGADNDWDTGDAYRVATPRFGDLYQDVAAQRPTVTSPGGIGQAAFARAASSALKVPLVDGLAATDWTVAYEYVTAAAAGNDHPVIWFPNLSIWRRNAAGNYKYRHGVTDVVGAGDMPAGVWVLSGTGAATGALLQDGVPALAGSLAPQVLAAGDPAGYLGYDGAGNYCDVTLRSVQVWNRMASPLEVDFAFHTLGAAASYAQVARATMAVRQWTDYTGATPQQVPRTNFSVYAPQRFHFGMFPAGGAARVQVAAAVDGLVQPDSALGGLLFDMHCAEYPSAGHPAVYQDAGWSAVWDVVIDTPGHYTIIVHRAESGSQVLHLDMEEV
jgi:hypothetical protein